MDCTGEGIPPMESERKPWAGWKRQNIMPLFGDREEEGLIGNTLTGQWRLTDQITGFRRSKLKRVMGFLHSRKWIPA
jgi:hypothetical protein